MKSSSSVSSKSAYVTPPILTIEAVKRSAPIASVPKRPKQDPVKTETKLKRDPAAKLKSDIREDVKLVPTARKPSWVVAASSRTQKRIDDSRNPTKGVKRSGPIASVTKPPKRSLVKTEAKPKKDCVAHNEQFEKFREDAIRRLNALQKELDAITFTPIRSYITENQDPPTPSSVVAASSRTQKRIDDSRNLTKGVKRSGCTASVAKQPKRSLVKTEAKPKKDCVAKLKAPASRWKF
ncbi:uncharacterized protein LOC143631727 [Bidens hawaiensis]|uniref:uncharacterized protein LOC143631727 n=1 Tax=Bidens hawaiensis TaxID=980011 RepID=UPI00404B7B51